MTVKIVNHESCTEVPEDTVGEIWVHSPSKAQGYFEKSEETRQDFMARLADDGSASSATVEYLRTGDLGFMHKRELFICGRLKDLIIVGGRNYYPQDLEATAEAAGSDMVRLGCSAAFTVDTTRAGDEEVALVMELKQIPPKNQIEAVCAPLVQQIKAGITQEHSLSVAEILLLETRTVPKTSSGKIARAWCRKGYLANSLKVVYRKSFVNSSSKGSSAAANDSAPARIASLEIEGNGEAKGRKRLVSRSHF